MNRVALKSLVIALLPPTFVVLTLLFERLEVSSGIRGSLFFMTTVCMAGLLFRLYDAMRTSRHSEKLAGARIHLVLHLVPFLFVATHILRVRPTWLNPVLVVLFFFFFVSGRMTWKALGALFPSSKLYHIFYRCNSAFMTSFPVLYLATFVIPDTVRFGMIRRVGLFYFSIHMAILGVSALKIESDVH